MRIDWRNVIEGAGAVQLFPSDEPYQQRASRLARQIELRCEREGISWEEAFAAITRERRIGRNGLFLTNISLLAGTLILARADQDALAIICALLAGAIWTSVQVFPKSDPQPSRPGQTEQQSAGSRPQV